jgi:hypothetical protein
VPLVDPVKLVQTAFTELTSNTTTTSGTFVDLLTLTITTGANAVLVHFSVSVNNNDLFAQQQQQFQLLVDGVATRGCSVRSINSNHANSGGLVYKTGVLTAGSHTFKIQWLTGGSTAQIRPVATATEHASLILKEVTV